MLIELDDGFSFGLGLFETILLYKGKPIFLDEHLVRINQSIIDLGLNIDKLEKNEVYQYLETNKSELEHEVLKIVLTDIEYKTHLEKINKIELEDFLLNYIDEFSKKKSWEISSMKNEVWENKYDKGNGYKKLITLDDMKE